MATLYVYSTPWCSDCRNLKRFLEAEGVAFTEINIDENEAAASELVEKTGKRGIPYLKYEDRWIKGYPLVPGAYRTLLRELGLL